VVRSLRLASLLLAGACALALPAAARAQSAETVRAAEALRDAALKSNVALDYVTQVTTRFGARPAGSPAEQAAAAWSAEYLK